MKTPEEFVNEYYQLPDSKIETVRIKSLIKCIERYINYLETEVEKLNIPDVSSLACEHPNDMRVAYHDEAVLCTKCNCIISQFGKEINPPHKL